MTLSMPSMLSTPRRLLKTLASAISAVLSSAFLSPSCCTAGVPSLLSPRASLSALPPIRESELPSKFMPSASAPDPRCSCCGRERPWWLSVDACALKKL